MFITMAGFGNTPFGIGGAGTIANFWTSAQHGTAEQWSGTVFGAAGYGGPLGMTPPLSPRRSLSPRTGPRRGTSPRGRDREEEDDANRDRERDRRRRPPQESRDDQPLPEGWGARMLTNESKIRELTASVESMKQIIEAVNTKANTKIDQMKMFVDDVECRFSQVERSLPERIHNLERTSENFVTMVNGLTFHLKTKFKGIEDSIKANSVPPVPPSFGGTNRAEHFGIGSPLSAPPTSAEPDPWFAFSQSRSAYSSGAPQSPIASNGWNVNAPSQPPSPPVMPPTPTPAAPSGAHRPFDSKDWNAVDVKVAKELKPFNGTHAAYKIWAGRVKDHFKKKNKCWGYLFGEIEAQKAPIHRANLVMRSFNIEGCSFEVDLAWASNQVWTFVGEHVVDTIYTNRGILSGGGENGLELWRALFLKHEGGATQVELGGMGSLHSFPQCDKPENLQIYIGKWQEMKDTYGGGISDQHLKSMFLNILPPNVQKEVREKPELTTLQTCIDHVLSDLGRINDANLSKLHM